MTRFLARDTENPTLNRPLWSLSFTMTRPAPLSRERPLERRRSFTPTSDSALVQQVDVATGQLLPLLCIIAREGTRSGRLSRSNRTRILLRFVFRFFSPPPRLSSPYYSSPLFIPCLSSFAIFHPRRDGNFFSVRIRQVIDEFFLSFSFFFFFFVTVAIVARTRDI